MPHSTPWSSASVPCRLEWRPSAWLTAALAVLGVLSSSAVVASGMPRALAWPLALAALAHGTRLARREARRPRRAWRIPAAGATSLDGVAVADMDVSWRGPLVFLRWRDPGGRCQHLAWWPDTLPPSRRRELRLALQARGDFGRAHAPASASMAP